MIFVILLVGYADAQSVAYVPTTYTSVLNFESCVGQTQIGDMPTVCLPRTRPTSCSSATWAQLQVSSAPLSLCPNSPPPQTLANYQQCVRRTPSGDVCLPVAQPLTCPTLLWTQVKLLLFIYKCPDGSTTAATQSAYQTVASYQLCIGQMQVNSQIAVCLPTAQPVGCPALTWTQLRNILPACPRTSLATFNYQSVPNYQSCVKQTGNTVCLPGKQPMLCPLSSYTQLQRLLPAIVPMCEPLDFFDAVSMVTVANYKQCVGQEFREDGPPMVCVSSSRPTACPESLWQQLRALIYDNSIGGALASCSNRGPPYYMTVPSYKLCLGQEVRMLNSMYTISSSKSLCTPTQKPMDCPSSSWTRLQAPTNDSPFPACTSGGSFVGLAPPAYESVANSHSCLGELYWEPVCLPPAQPLACALSTWTQLQRMLPTCAPRK